MQLHIKCATPLLIVFLAWALSTASQNLKIYQIDVEQGDATLIISPSGKTLLIDSGGENKGSRVRKLLDSEHISRIDYFVCTHYHADHYGGIDELVNSGNISIGTVYDRGDKQYLPIKTLNSGAFKNYQSSVGEDAIHLTRGVFIPIDPEISVRCIASGGVVLKEYPPVFGKDENDMSIALLINYGDFSYFTGGDIEVFTEEKIAVRDQVLDVDVCKSNHHGSNACSLPEFMQDMIPKLIIISNGSTSNYKHPSQVTLNTYHSLIPKPVVLQTNKYLKSDQFGGNEPDRFIADLETIDDDGNILIQVNRQAKNYTVSYRDTSMIFNTKQRPICPDCLAIMSLLPDPEGSDYVNEKITLLNNSINGIDLTGYFLMNGSNRIWSLDGLQVGAGDSLAVIRNRMPMSLSNSGGIIKLIGPSNQVIDEFTYSAVKEGVVIKNH